MFYVLKISDLVCFVVFGMFSVIVLAWYSMVYMRLLKHVLLSGMACSGFCMFGYWSWRVLATVCFGYAHARLMMFCYDFGPHCYPMQILVGFGF